MDLVGWLASKLPGGRNYVSSKYSRERLYHKSVCDCPYCSSIHRENKVFFRTKKKAETKGLRMCRICKGHVQQKSISDYT